MKLRNHKKPQKRFNLTTNGGVLKKNLFLLIILVISISLYSQIEDQTIFFSVSVTGMVEQPGVYHLPPTSRVSEAIVAANIANSAILSTNLTEEDSDVQINQFETLDFDNMYIPEIEEINEPSAREIILRRNGAEIILDLEAFYSLGLIENNPYIKDGDVIYIPPVRQSVEIAGEINKPGVIEIKNGETLADIIDLSQGFTAYANSEDIRISRIDPKNGELVEIRNSFSNITSNYTLHNDDYIFIEKLSAYTPKSYVTIYNGAGKSSRHLIFEDKTTLLSLLQNVNFDQNRVDFKQSFIQRTNKNEIPNPEFERLKPLSPLEMSFNEYAYFKAQIKELKGKFSLDIEDLFINGNNDLDITLKDGDFIYLSGKINTVLVTGSVKNPGLIEYKPDQNYQYYIDMAGGLSQSARKGKIRVIRGNSEEWMKPKKNIILNPGDTVFIPEKNEVNYWSIFKETIVILSQIGTLILVIDNTTTKQ